MTIHYILLEEDYLKYNIYHYKNSPTTMRMLMFLRILLPVLVGLIALISDNKLLYLITGGLPALLWFFFLPKIYWRMMKKMVQKLVGEGQGNEFIGPRTLTLGQERLRMETPDRLCEDSYRIVQRIEEDSEYIYIYVGSLSAYCIPLRAFKDQKEKNDFLDLLRGNIAAKK